jgi:hypothetical protein
MIENKISTQTQPAGVHAEGYTNVNLNFSELEEICFQSDLNSVGSNNSAHSSAEDLYKLQDFPVLCQSQLNLLNQQKKIDPDCDGLCEWTCKLCKKRDPSDRRRNATMRERRRLKRVNEAYDGLKKCAVRNPAQRLPKVQILRAAIARIDQLQKMLYSEDELKTMMKRLDGSASPYPKYTPRTNITSSSDLGSLNELVNNLTSVH